VTEKVSARDREYIRRLGELERAAYEELLEYHRSLPLAERLRRSFERTARGKPYPRKEPEDLAAIYARAKRLGLYRG